MLVLIVFFIASHIFLSFKEIRLALSPPGAAYPIVAQWLGLMS